MTWQTRSSLTPKVLSENQWQLHWLSVETGDWIYTFSTGNATIPSGEKKKRNPRYRNCTTCTYREAGSVAVLPRRYAPMGPGSIPSPGTVCAFGIQQRWLWKQNHFGDSLQLLTGTAPPSPEEMQTSKTQRLFLAHVLIWISANLK